MNKLLLLAGTLVSMHGYSQTTIFSDNFEAGSGNWTLNGGSGNNQWAINNIYVGDDFGIVSDTPDEPGTFTGGTNSTYMHIYNTDLCSIANGCNANFDTGSSSNQSATKATTVSTSGFTNVNLEFYYLCDGAGATSFGVVEYSLDNGSTWTAAGTQYSGVTTWTMVSLMNPIFNNQPSLKFRFRWQNSGGAGNDPAFSIDEVKLTGDPASSVSIGTGALQNNSSCSNVTTNISVPFVATGTVNAGNQYIAKLSDASGSFASPTTIGTLNSNASGSLTISATIPTGLPTGTGYLVRVDASNPNTIGAVSATSISVNAAPAVTFISLPSNGIICNGQSATIQASGGNSYVWTPAGSLNSSNTATVTANPTTNTTYSVFVTGQTGCSTTATFFLQVDNCAGLAENSELDWTIFPNPTKGELTIDLPENAGYSNMKITDLSGRTVQEFNTIAKTIDVSSYQSGTYVILLSGNNGSVQKAFIKQ